MAVFLGILAGIMMPLFNIPLMLRIHRRKSSSDVSLIWAVGVYACVLLLLPSAIISEDLVFKSFAIVNAVLFSGVVYYVAKYRKK